MTDDVKNLGGRPIILNETVLAKCEIYLNGCEDEEYQLTKSAGDKNISYENKIKVKLPTIEGLALSINVHKETIFEWEKRDLQTLETEELKDIFQRFSDFLSRLRNKQAERLLNNGLSGDYNPVIAKLILTKHGYRDSQELVGGEGKPLIPDPDTKKIADEAVAAYISQQKISEQKNDNSGNTQQQQTPAN